jgi:hypothetical protein
MLFCRLASEESHGIQLLDSFALGFGLALKSVNDLLKVR